MLKNMLKKVAIIITPNYKDYAKKYLADCVKSIRAQEYTGEMKIFITDNETSEESYGYLKKVLTPLCPPLVRGGIQKSPHPPFIPTSPRLRGAGKGGSFEIIRNKTNDGFAKGVNDSVRVALKQGFDYIAVVNIHTIIEPNYISELVKAAESDKKIGVAQARMMLYPEKDKINSLGNITHFLGFGYCSHYREKWDKKEIKNQKPARFESRSESGGSKIKNICYPSGSSMFFKREVLEQVGLLDEEYWMYNEDQELGWRIWLAGFRCVLAPKAVMYNKYEFQRSIQKFYWMDRNRINAILQCYRLPTLLLILPAFVIMEAGLILFSLRTGWLKEKMRVWRYFLTPRKWVYIYRARKRNQALRKVKDKDIIKMFSGRIWYQEVGNWKLHLINPFFNLYWKAVLKVIKFLKL
jgi:hypothetical protein